MNILMVGTGKGSWQMRGLQIGRAIGARATTSPTDDDWAWADVVVLVKRAAVQWQDVASRLRVPVVWDVLDFWAQPEDNERTMISEVRRISATTGTHRLIAATKAMAEDIGGTYLPHHSLIGLQPTPPRQRAKIVGYHGSKKYLGVWLVRLQDACEAMGLTFVVNPPDISAVDVFVSFRDGKWDGWVCREWKSGIKLVNAIVAGRPIISQHCQALVELHPVGSTVEYHDELIGALEHTIRRDVRDEAYEHGLRRGPDFSLQTIASQYLSILHDVRSVAV